MTCYRSDQKKKLSVILTGDVLRIFSGSGGIRMHIGMGLINNIQLIEH